MPLLAKTINPNDLITELCKDKPAACKAFFLDARKKSGDAASIFVDLFKTLSKVDLNITLDDFNCAQRVNSLFQIKQNLCAKMMPYISFFSPIELVSIANELLALYEQFYYKHSNEAVHDLYSTLEAHLDLYRDEPSSSNFTRNHIISMLYNWYCFALADLAPFPNEATVEYSLNFLRQQPQDNLDNTSKLLALLGMIAIEKKLLIAVKDDIATNFNYFCINIASAKPLHFSRIVSLILMEDNISYFSKHSKYPVFLQHLPEALKRCTPQLIYGELSCTNFLSRNRNLNNDYIKLYIEALHNQRVQARFKQILYSLRYILDFDLGLSPLLISELFYSLKDKLDETEPQDIMELVTALCVIVERYNFKDLCPLIQPIILLKPIIDKLIEMKPRLNEVEARSVSMSMIRILCRIKAEAPPLDLDYEQWLVSSVNRLFSASVVNQSEPVAVKAVSINQQPARDKLLRELDAAQQQLLLKEEHVLRLQKQIQHTKTRNEEIEDSYLTLRKQLSNEQYKLQREKNTNSKLSEQIEILTQKIDMLLKQKQTMKIELHEVTSKLTKFEQLFKKSEEQHQAMQQHSSELEKQLIESRVKSAESQEQLSLACRSNDELKSMCLNQQNKLRDLESSLVAWQQKYVTANKRAMIAEERSARLQLEIDAVRAAGVRREQRVSQLEKQLMALEHRLSQSVVNFTTLDNPPSLTSTSLTHLRTVTRSSFFAQSQPVKKLSEIEIAFGAKSS